MTRLIQRIGQTLHDWVQRILHRISQQMDLLRDLVGNIFNLHHEYEGLVFTLEEESMISESAALLEEFFPTRPGAMLASEDYESRFEAVEDLAERLKVLYGLEDHEVIITDDPVIIGGEDGMITRGIIVFSNKRIYINAACLRSVDETVLDNVILTIIHEMRHAMQLQVATGVRRYGVPYHRRRAWRENIANYIQPEHDYEGYYKQPIEFDARAFASHVWQQAYQK